MKKLITIIIFLITFAMPVVATSYNCLDDITLQRTYNYTFETDSSILNLTVTREENCQFGCDNVTYRCKPNPSMQNVIFFVGIATLLLILGIVVKLLGRKL